MTSVSRSRVAAIALSSALLATALPAAAHAAEPIAYTLDTTVAVGAITRTLAVDDAAGRVYVPVDKDNAPGAVTWFDTRTRTAADAEYALSASAPDALELSADGSTLYVLHYGTGTLSVLDAATGAEIRTIAGLPEYPGGLVQDTDTGMLYVLDDGLVPVDPATGTVGAQVAISTQAYPLLKDAVYDSTNRMIWVAEGRAGVVTGFNTVSGRWIDSLAIPISSFAVDGAPTGGRPSLLAIDEQLGHLYVAVQPTFSDPWDNDKIVTIDTSSTLHLGAPIETGDTGRQLAVNPVTHELYALNGFSNTLSVISPDSWSVTHTIDFTAEGVTDGTGTANADVWALGVNAAGTELYVTHPYGQSRLSVISRTGDAPAITEPAVAPGQDEPTEPETPVNAPWEGPEAAVVKPAPTGAVGVEGSTLRWSLNEYAKAWAREGLGSVALDTDDFVFAAGTGWADPVSGAATLSWADGFRIRHYPALAPEVITTFGNPVLTIDAAGAGTLSFDVSWSVAADTASDGYRRVVVATFSDAALTHDGDAWTVVGTPDYAGRTFDTGSAISPASFPAEFIEWFDPSMRPWWYSTGASMDDKKVPNAFTASFLAAAIDDTEPGTGPVVTEPTPVASTTPAPVAGTRDAAALATTGAQAPTALAVTAGVLLLAGGLLLALRRRRATR